jgi:spermidine synthase
VDLRDPTYLGFDYAAVVAAAIDTQAPPRRAVTTLHVGGGAFTLPRYLTAVRPGSRNTVMELDQAVVDTARQDFGLRNREGLRIEVGDARLLVEDESAHTYDFAIGDAFSGRSVPWHLTTREFLEQLERLLRPRGTYLMNLIDGRLRFVRAEAATLKLVFRHVALLRSLTATNHILVASNAPVDATEIAARVAERPIDVVPFTGARLDRLIGDARVLEDDFAPVDQLLN